MNNSDFTDSHLKWDTDVFKECMKSSIFRNSLISEKMSSLRDMIHWAEYHECARILNDIDWIRSFDNEKK